MKYLKGKLKRVIAGALSLLMLAGVMPTTAFAADNTISMSFGPAYTESEMLEVLNMERSRYYDRKKEAITVFGLSLWGSALPKLKSFLEDEVYEDTEGMMYGE